jgi:hypothetical protein
MPDEEDDKTKRIISRAHYIRWNPSKDWFLYAGLMDKVFGIRTPDHTAYSRSETGLAQNDQSHGLVLQYNIEPWEFTFNPFLGNLSQRSDLRQVGASFMLEKDIGEKLRVGGAYINSKNDYIRWQRAEVHSKLGYGSGHSFLTELGLIHDDPLNNRATQSTYVLAENLTHLARGYKFLTQFDFFNRSGSRNPNQYRWTIGFLSFPAPRYEVRGTLINSRAAGDEAANDLWQFQTQFHVSF